ncbi:MAG: LLM class F420-dependent oxidoreductase [Nitriliruptoraceae bacterium]
MVRCKVGVQLHPQATTTDALRAAARAVEEAGFDSLWTWDHFFPLYGDPDAAHFEAWTLLSAFAVETSRVQLGLLVSAASYRNPHLLADMARTVDHLSHGRAVLGIGAGWFERDYTEYEFPFGTGGGRLRDLEGALHRISRRLDRLVPPPAGDLPLLIGGGGETVTLRIVAERADIWNGIGPPELIAHKNAVLDRWCADVDRDPAEIERSVLIKAEQTHLLDDYLEAGVDHLMVECGDPFDLGPAEALLAAVRT